MLVLAYAFKLLVDVYMYKIGIIFLHLTHRVYVCLLAFVFHQVYNATAEIADAANYPDIRVFTADLNMSVKPEIDLLGIAEQWSPAGPGEWSAVIS